MFYRRERRDGTLGKVYWTRLNGERISTGCTDIRAAEAWRRAREREKADPTYLRAKGARLEDVVQDFLAELRRRGRAPKTIEKNEKKLGHFLTKWGVDFALAGVDARLVSSYIDERLTEQGIRIDISEYSKCKAGRGDVMNDGEAIIDLRQIPPGATQIRTYASH